MKDAYIFTTKRLGIRNWTEEDIPTFSQMGKDKEVMKYFPKTLSEKNSVDFILRMQKQFEEKKYAYLAVDILEKKEFIGMIGIMDQNYGNYLDDFVDIGWRLKKLAWGKGYATEGAKGWINFGFEKFDLKRIYAVAPVLNLPSQNVMKKIGMEKVDEIEHPKIPQESSLRKCALFKIDK